jgi:hypothetical protein
MQIFGAELIQTLIGQPNFEAKCVFNESGMGFFAASQQHKSMKFSGVSYEDDYKGNALAAMIKPGCLEVRYHKDFSDDRVRSIWSLARAEPAAAFLHNWRIVYQGRAIH